MGILFDKQKINKELYETLYTVTLLLIATSSVYKS
jgi:hypothetical protein